MGDHWLKMIIMDDFDKALLAIDVQIEYVSGYAQSIDAAATHLEALKTTRHYLVDLHEEYMTTSSKSPFADPEKARWVIENGYLEKTALYKKVKNSGKHGKPPGADGPGGPGGGKPPPGGPKPPGKKPPGGPPRGKTAGPPPKITVPGGGFSFKFIMNQFEKMKRAGIITGGSGGGGAGGFVLLSQMLIGLAGSGSIVAATVVVTAGDKAEEATRQAKAKGQQSELGDYFSYLAEWAKAAWKALSSEDAVKKVPPPLDFTTWLNRRPPKFGT